MSQLNTNYLRVMRFYHIHVIDRRGMSPKTVMNGSKGDSFALRIQGSKHHMR